MVCVEKIVVVPVPGRGVQVPTPPPPPVDPEVELQGAPGITVGVRAQVWHKHASPPPGLPPPPAELLTDPLDVLEPPGPTNDVTVDTGMTVIVAPDGKAELG